MQIRARHVPRGSPKPRDATANAPRRSRNGIAAGAVLLYVNRPQPYRADVKVETALHLLPTVGPHGAGAVLFTTF